MYAGQIVEQADKSHFFSDPQHPYSQKLFRSVPTMEKRSQPLEVIQGTVPSLTQEFTGCRFAPRCEHVQSVCRSQLPEWSDLGGNRGVRCLLANTPQFENHGFEDQSNDKLEQVTVTATGEELESTELLQVSDLKVHFPIHKGLFQRVAGHVYAVDGIDLNLYTGRTVALVGESGCGKTTAGKGILQLLRQVTSGAVRFDGERLDQLTGEALRKKRSEFQIIFQDPYSSMNPRMTVADIVEEGMLAQGVGSSAQERQQKVDELLEQVGLEAEMKQRYPHEFSGGQRQRICIARALAVNPRLIVCDEPTSALDVSVQAQILNLLKSLQDKMGLSYLFITHDISVVAYLAHEVAVMYLGRIVEQGPVEEVLNNPKHPYTRALLSAVPVIDKDKQTEVIRVEGDIPSPINPPKGCHFHPRCPEAMPVCCERYPEAFTHSPEGKKDDIHRTRCFLYQ
ncbi:MAG: dipeptide ABC transporter ATP-binding protein [Gammaproteobacteria bacterium]|nr:dipeptide ABC transporter ATP-binding protein [Gammaproteobacteria bacterium]